MLYNACVQIYVLDTCAFKSLLNDEHSAFDYSEIIEQVQKKEAAVVITPYSLYETLKYLKDVTQFKGEALKLLSKTEFWVADVDRILGTGKYHQGAQFVFQFHIHTDAEYEKFCQELDSFELKVINGLAPLAAKYMEVLACLYLIFKELDNKGSIDGETMLIMRLIRGYYAESSASFIAEFFGLVKPRLSGKEILRQLLEVALNHIIADATAAKEVIKLGLERDPIAFRYLAMKNRVANNLSIESFSRELINLRKRQTKSGNKHWIAMASYELVYKDLSPLEAFKTIIDNAFITNDIFNDLIDLSNYAFACNYGGQAIYITEERKWIETVLKTDNPAMAKTKNFYISKKKRAF